MFVCFVIQGTKRINNCPGRVLEYCFFALIFVKNATMPSKTMQAAPPPFFSTPFWSTSSSLLSELGVQQIPFDHKIIEIFGSFHAAPLVLFSIPEFFHQATTSCTFSLPIPFQWCLEKMSLLMPFWMFYSLDISLLLCSWSVDFPRQGCCFYADIWNTDMLSVSWMNHCDRKTLLTASGKF